MGRFIVFIISCLVPLISMGNTIDTIDVSFTKTVMLVFDSDTKVTLGSESVQAVAEGNTVTIVALEERFEETNMFIKSGNTYYVFILRYNESPARYLYNFTDHQGNTTNTVVDRSQELQEQKEMDFKRLEEESLRLMCLEVYDIKPEISDIGDINGKVYFMLLNMYVRDSLLFFKIGINNKSRIDYEINHVKFKVMTVDRRLKSASDQKVPKEVKYILDENKLVKAKKSMVNVFVLDKFTMDNERKLHVEMWEKGGDRICQFELTSKQLLSIQQL